MPHNESLGETGIQVNLGGGIVMGFMPTLPNPLQRNYATYRLMRTQPTLALGRALSVGPIASGEWAVESRDDVPEEWIQFVRDEFLSRRQPFMETSMYGGIDFGWQPYEKVFELREDDGLIHLKKLKPLLQDLTTILINGRGSFVGFEQARDHVTVPLELSLLVSFRVEGTQWHGQSLLENARKAFNRWTAADDGADRYDRRLAGAQWFIQYPHGKSIDDSGALVENKVIAQALFDKIQSCGDIGVGKPADEANKWEIDQLGGSGAKQADFVPRLGYLDQLMMRAILLPERAALEGRYGTRADAEAHADMAITSMELSDKHITTILNWHCVDQLLVVNFGEAARGTVWLASAPLVDSERETLVKIYEKILSNPGGFFREVAAIDATAIREKIGIPSAVTDQDETVEPLEGVVIDDDDPLVMSMEKLYSDEVVLRNRRFRLTNAHGKSNGGLS